MTVLGTLGVLFGLAVLTGESHEGFPVCSGAVPPAGAQSVDTAYHSYRIGAFPLGLDCLWNMSDGSVQTQFYDSWAPTVEVYGGILMGLAGAAVLARRRPANRSPELEFEVPRAELPQSPLLMRAQMTDRSAVLQRTDGVAAEWLRQSLASEGRRVENLVPAGFDSYVRILNPVESWDARYIRSVTSWRDVAAAKGIGMRPSIDWDDLADDDGSTVFGEPASGTLDADVALHLAQLVRRNTQSGDECFSAIWTGYADTPTLAGVPEIIPPSRSMYVFTGAVEAIARPLHERIPLRWWPADHSWCLAGDLYGRSVYLGASRSLVRAILDDPQLEAYAISQLDDLESLE